MPYFKKLPVVIEARELTADNQQDIISWIFDYEGEVEILSPFLKREGGYTDDYAFQIKTLEGWHWAKYGDFIIKGVQGEFYPCKPDIFVETYEEAILE